MDYDTSPDFPSAWREVRKPWGVSSFCFSFPVDPFLCLILNDFLSWVYYLRTGRKKSFARKFFKCSFTCENKKITEKKQTLLNELTKIYFFSCQEISGETTQNSSLPLRASVERIQWLNLCFWLNFSFKNANLRQMNATVSVFNLLYGETFPLSLEHLHFLKSDPCGSYIKYAINTKPGTHLS